MVVMIAVPVLYAQDVAARMRDAGLRVDVDERNEKIGAKIRDAIGRKIPYLLVVGDREVESGAVAVRTRSGEDLGAMTVAEFAQHLAEDVGRRGRTDN